ncbi:hypothetical protein [Listeria aquatica]|uniref:hypothetical protein n=1 Tax=Listeria aquatica TaxID=1494960 RepID=UPI0031F5A7DD
MEYLDYYRILKKDKFIENMVRQELTGKKRHFQKGDRMPLEKDRILLIDGVLSSYVMKVLFFAVLKWMIISMRLIRRIIK